MTKRFYADSDRVVIFEEAPGGGDPLDPNSLMNRPIISPMDWLDNVFFHSDFDYYNTFIATTATVSHPFWPTGTNGTPTLGGVVRNSRTYTTDLLVIDHNLGYVPKFYAAINGKMIPNTYPVQFIGSQAFRYVCVYATTTQIRVYETSQTSNTTSMPATDITYQILVFADSDIDPSLEFLEIEPGSVVFGQGKFRMDQPPMRVADSTETPFAQSLNRSTFIRNGVTRSYLPDGTFVDAGPYNGSATPPNFINVQSGLF